MGSSRVEQWRHTHKQTVTLTHRLLPLSQTSSGLVGQCTPQYSNHSTFAFQKMWVPYIYSTNRINVVGLEINACKKWGEGTLRNLFVLLCLLCTLPKPESWPIKYKIIYYINYTWEPFSLVMPTVGVHPSLKPDSRLAEEAAAVCVWVWLSVCGWISTAQPCYSPCGPGPQADRKCTLSQ